MRQGKWLVVLLLLLALSMSAFAWWYQRSQSESVLTHWGAAIAMRIEKAEPVVACRLDPPMSENGSDRPNRSSRSVVTIGPRTYTTGQPMELTGRRGFLHFRHALLASTSYDWGAKPPNRPDWKYLLRFGEGDEAVELILAPESRVIALRDGSQIAVLGPIAETFGEYIEEPSPRR